MINLAVIRSGCAGRRVLAEVNVGDRCKAFEEIMALEADLQDRVFAIFDVWVWQGKRGVDTGVWGWLHKGKPKIEEWKPDKHTRIHWYCDQGDIILIRVTRKNDQKARKEDIQRAIKFANRYEEEKKRNELKYVAPGGNR